MPTTWASSERAQQALSLVSSLQHHFRDGFQTLAPESTWESVEWQRHRGTFGGGTRLAVTSSPAAIKNPPSPERLTTG